MNYNLLITFFISIIIIFILIIIGNFLFYFLSKNKIEKIELNKFIFQGIIFGFSFFIIIGYILSYFTIFNSLYIGLISLIIFCISIISLYYKNHFFIIFNKKGIIVILFFLLISIFIYKYNFNSIYPYGYDQGKHFGNMFYLLNNSELSFFHPGTNLKEYYFQTPNILIGYLVVFSNFFKNVSYNSIDDIKSHLLFFKIFFTFLSLIYIFIFSVFSKNTKEFIAYILFFLFISINGFFNAGSIGTFLTFFYILGYIYYDKNYTINNKKIILIFLGSIIFIIHPISVLFFIVYKIVEILFNLFKKDFTKIKEIIFVNTISFILAIGYLFIFYKVFLFGFKDEIIRKYFTNHISENTTNVGKTFFEKNLDNIVSIDNIYIVLLFIFLGVFYIIKNKHKNKLFLFFITILLFLCFKISPLIKTGQFIIILFSVLGGMGILMLFKRNKLILFLFLFIFFLLSISTINYFINNGYKRFSYINEETYIKGLKINELLEGLKGNIIIPNSGALGYFTYGLNNNILIAEPRYNDMYSMSELSKLYNSYLTNRGNFKNNLNFKEYTKIINKYNIKAILGSKYYIVNKDLIKKIILKEIKINQNDTLYILK